MKEKLVSSNINNALITFGMVFMFLNIINNTEGTQFLISIIFSTILVVIGLILTLMKIRNNIKKK